MQKFNPQIRKLFPFRRLVRSVNENSFFYYLSTKINLKVPESFPCKIFQKVSFIIDWIYVYLCLSFWNFVVVIIDFRLSWFWGAARINTKISLIKLSFICSSRHGYWSKGDFYSLLAILFVQITKSEVNIFY